MSQQSWFRCAVSKTALWDALRFTALLRRKSAASFEQQVRLTTKNESLICEGFALRPGLSLAVTMPLSEPSRPSAIVLNADPLQKALAETDAATVVLRGIEDHFFVEACNGRSVLASLPWFAADDFPTLPTSDAVNLEVSIHADGLRKLWQKIAPWTRGCQEGVHLEFDGNRLKAVATDGHAMVIYSVSCPVNNPKAITVSPMCLQAWTRLKGRVRLEMKTCSDGVPLLVVSGKSGKICARQFSSFPNYRKAHLPATKTVDFWVPDLRHAIEAARVQIRGEERPLCRFDLTLDQRTIAIKAGSETFQVPYACASETDDRQGWFCINPHLVFEALRKCPAKSKIRLCFTETTEVTRWESLKTPLCVYIMPMRPPS